MIVHIIHGPFLFALNPRRFSKFLSICYVHTQFGTTITSVQCDNDREFDNSLARTFFLTHGVIIHVLCPYASQQNGRLSAASAP